MSWDWSTEDVDSRLLFENMVCMVYLAWEGLIPKNKDDLTAVRVLLLSSYDIIIT
jgi:hypothetical protein